MARLILATAEGQQVVDLRPVNSLGRHPNNSIQLLDKIVSKEHCIIELRGDQFVLRDLGSLNGTYINGDRVAGEQGLRHGDEIALGSTRARFDDGTGAVATPAATPIAQPQSMNRPFGAPPVPSQAKPSYGAPPSTGTPGPMASPLARSGASDQAQFGVQPQPPFPQAPQRPPLHQSGTRIEIQAQERAIGTQIAAVQKGFLPFEQVASNPVQLRDDYERLRMSHELSREIALERDTTKLLEKILATIFKFTRADRGVIFLRDETGELRGMVSRRRDGSDTPITVSSTIMNHVMTERAAVLSHDAAMDFAAAKGKSMILNRISSAIVVPLMHNNEVLGILWLDSESLAVFQPKDLELVAAVANQAAMFIEINILGKKVEAEIVARERFARLVSPNVAEQIVSGALKIEKGGALVKECTVFNSDIRGFTRMSEGTPAQVVVEMLNDYFEMMVESIFQFEGTLDKFMGDGIMALWGAPVVHPDDAIRSVRSAIEQMDALGRFNRKRAELGQPSIGIGIGIHTGELVAGYVGSSKALSYTVIGDTVNTSARLCGLAESGQIVVSEDTFARLGGRFEVEEMPPARLKGKEKPLRLYNVLRERTQLETLGAPPLACSLLVRAVASASKTPTCVTVCVTATRLSRSGCPIVRSVPFTFGVTVCVTATRLSRSGCPIVRSVPFTFGVVGPRSRASTRLAWWSGGARVQPEIATDWAGCAQQRKLTNTYIGTPMTAHPFRKRYLVVAALSILAVSYGAGGKPKPPASADPGPQIAANTNQESEATPAHGDMAVPAKATASAVSCAADMVLVEGSYCTKPVQECISWMEDPAQFSYARCAKYKSPSTCAGDRVAMKFCMDREEHSAAGSDLPLGDVSWTDAKGICEKQGKRLCGEREWTFACEGEEMRPYPYGFTRDSSMCNFEQDGLVEKGKLRDGRMPATEKPQCLSPFGVHNMVGNIDEWVVLAQPHYSARSNYAKMNSGLKGGWWGPLRNRCRPVTVDHDEYFHELQTGVRCCGEADTSRDKRASNDVE